MKNHCCKIMKKSFLTIAAGGYLLAATITSCSVKEDRSVCPCLLDVDLLGAPAARAPFLTGLTQGNGVTYSEFQSPAEETFEVSRSRADVFACSIKDIARDRIENTVYRIPEGQQADSLWSFSGYAECAGETDYIKAELHKQFAAVDLEVIGMPENSQVSLEGEVNGMDLLTRTPVEGPYSLALSKGDDGHFHFTLPRQNPQSRISLYVNDGGGNVDFDLAGWIRAEGYDWDAADLDDIRITFNYQEMDVTVEIKDWNETDQSTGVGDV